MTGWWRGQVIGSPRPGDRIVLHLFASDGTDLKVYLERDEAKKIGAALTQLADATIEA